MMAEVLGRSPQAVQRWQRRKGEPRPAAERRGRPQAVSSSVRQQLRCRYTDSLKQWGPAVLACWAKRQGLGSYCATTVSRAIEDLKPSPPPTKPKQSYEVAGPGVLWSEDGAGFGKGHGKKELLLVQDECSRFKVGHELCVGPAKGSDVRALLSRLFKQHGAPLVLKRDGGSIFNDAGVMELLEEHQVTVLTSPPYTPQYNGRCERAFRDIRSHERAQRKAQTGGTLAERIDRAIDDLNEHRPRPTLRGRTAREVQGGGPVAFPPRNVFRQEIETRRIQLVEQANSRHERDQALRRAIEDVLSKYDLVTWKGDV
jgi:transposase InsO family protein